MTLPIARWQAKQQQHYPNASSSSSSHGTNQRRKSARICADVLFNHPIPTYPSMPNPVCTKYKEPCSLPHPIRVRVRASASRIMRKHKRQWLAPCGAVTRYQVRASCIPHCQPPTFLSTCTSKERRACFPRNLACCGCRWRLSVCHW